MLNAPLGGIDDGAPCCVAELIAITRGDNVAGANDSAYPRSARRETKSCRFDDEGNFMVTYLSISNAGCGLILV